MQNIDLPGKCGTLYNTKKFVITYKNFKEILTFDDFEI